MAITEPLTLPANGLANITWRKQTAASKSQSPFTYKEQVFVHPGRRWAAEVEVVPVDDTVAGGEWEAFFMACDGPRRRFLLHDPVRPKPKGGATFTIAERELLTQGGGTLTTQAGDPILIQQATGQYVRTLSLSGAASARAESVTLEGFAASQTGQLLPGDIFQIGTGVDSRIHKVLTRVDSDANGAATVDIWPPLRDSYRAKTELNLENPKGVFRLDSNISEWDVEPPTIYSFTFTAVEAL
jgi:hypothetical protein